MAACIKIPSTGQMTKIGFTINITTISIITRFLLFSFILLNKLQTYPKNNFQVTGDSHKFILIQSSNDIAVYMEGKCDFDRKINSKPWLKVFGFREATEKPLVTE